MGAAMTAAYGRILDSLGLLAGAVIALLALMVSIDVVIRNLGIGNFPWLLEVAEYALYVTTFLAAPWVLHLGAHVRVDVLLNIVPTRGGYVFEVAADLVGLGASAVLFYYGLAATQTSYADGSLIFKELVVTEWYLMAAMPLSAVLLMVEFLLRLRRGAAGKTSQAEGL
jgi:TRAP-type C4-dicarboxylate transport system permease small subunit